jgi:hypothetical protein
VLSDQEQRSWKEIERSYAADGIRSLAVGAVAIAIMFVVIGAPWAGLVVVLVPALAWVLTRYWRDIGDACATGLVPVDGWVAKDAQSERRGPEADREVG